MIKFRRFSTVPLTRTQANSLISSWHRHHKPVRGLRFAVAATENGRVCGAVVVGRPVSHAIDQYAVAEVSRLVTDGTAHACSFLYGVAARIAKLMGFSKIQTYILAEEPGTSLKAAGWTFVRLTEDVRSWNRPRRSGRRDDQPQCKKQLWEKIL